MAAKSTAIADDIATPATPKFLTSNLTPVAKVKRAAIQAMLRSMGPDWYPAAAAASPANHIASQRR
jgi:hypothetical protein